MVGLPTLERALSRPKLVLPPVLGRLPPLSFPPWKPPLPLGRVFILGELVVRLLLTGELGRLLFICVLGRLLTLGELGRLLDGELGRLLDGELGRLTLGELLRGDELMLGELLRGDELMLGELLRGDELMLGELLRGDELCELLGRLPPIPPPPGRRPWALPGTARTRAAAVIAITANDCKLFLSIVLCI